MFLANGETVRDKRATVVRPIIGFGPAAISVRGENEPATRRTKPASGRLRERKPRFSLFKRAGGISNALPAAGTVYETKQYSDYTSTAAILKTQTFQRIVLGTMAKTEKSPALFSYSLHEFPKPRRRRVATRYTFE